MANKKHLIVLILKILETNSDKEHPMTQNQILDIIKRTQDCDRKTIGRNIKFLRESRFPIIKTPKGFYIDKIFSLDDIVIIKNALTNYKEITDDVKNNVIEKLNILNNFYKR